MPARTYRSSVLFGQIHPVTHLHDSYRAIFTFLVWQDLVLSKLGWCTLQQRNTVQVPLFILLLDEHPT